MSHKLKAVVVGSLALLVAACGPRDHHRHDRDQMQDQGSSTTTQSGAQSGQVQRPRIREACAAELQQYCANEPRRFRCLRDNQDKLGASCKAAFNEMREWRRQRRMERQNGQGAMQQNANPANTAPRPNRSNDDDDDQ
jgi:hypothetical protein